MELRDKQHSFRKGFGKQIAEGSNFLRGLLWAGLLAWVARVTIFVRQRTGGDFASVDAFAGIQIIIVLLLFLVVIFSDRPFRILPKIFKSSFAFLFIYYLICATSSLWSPMPKYSLYRSFEFIASSAAVIAALSYSKDFQSAERTVLFIGMLVIFMSMFVNVKLHGFSLSLSAWHTNSYTASAGMVFCYCLGEYFHEEGARKKRLLRYGMLGLGALCLGTSSASFVAALFGIWVIAVLYRNFILWFTVLWLLLIVIIFSFITAIDLSEIQNIIFYGKSTKSIVTGTGRIGMWQAFLSLVYKSPIIGHGFAVLSTGRGGVFASHPHNSLFSVLLGTGTIGMIAVGLYFSWLSIEAMKCGFAKVKGAIGSAGALAAGVVNSLAMPLVLDQWEESSLVFVSISALFILHVHFSYKKSKKSEVRYAFKLKSDISNF